MDSCVITGWCNTQQTNTIVDIIRKISEDYMEHTFDDEQDWESLWEYISVILPEIGFDKYLVEPFIRDIYNSLEDEPHMLTKTDRDQVEVLRQLKLPEQRTPEWFKFREGRLTASELSYCVSQPISSAVSQKIILQKIKPEAVPYISSAATSHGTLFEPVAQMAYERYYQTRLYEFGCIPHPRVDWLAASPDGITEDGVMVEIKCPYSRTPKGIPSLTYYTQIQAQLEVCDFEVCDFMECEIEMYESRAEYIKDTAERGDETSKTLSQSFYKGMRREYLPKQSSGVLKGVALLVETDKPVKYVCIEWGDMCRKKSKDWITEQLDKEPNLRGYTVKYWVLRRIWMTRVRKNRDWFASLLPKAAEFWQEVEKKKIEGVEVKPRPQMEFVEETM